MSAQIIPFPSRRLNSPPSVPYVEDDTARYLNGEKLNLNTYLICNPESTYYVRAAGNCMTPCIHDGDLLVVDRAALVKGGDIVIACVNDSLCVKRLRVRRGVKWLVPDNPAHEPFKLEGGHIWGKVTAVIHELEREAPKQGRRAR